MKLSTEEVIRYLKSGVKLRPSKWSDAKLFTGGYCTLDGLHIFVQRTPNTIGVKVSPVTAGVEQVVRQFGNDWEIVE
jgi:hypothetical protein